MAVFQNLLPTQKIYNRRNINYRFSALAMNFGTQLIMFDGQKTQTNII